MMNQPLRRVDPVGRSALNTNRRIATQRLDPDTGSVWPICGGSMRAIVDTVIVVAGLPAPPDSKGSLDFFERGVAGLGEAVKAASTRTAGMVGYIGEWHSHPPGHSASPSQHDLAQLMHLAHGMADDGLPAIQLIVGEHDLQILQGVIRCNRYTDPTIRSKRHLG